MFQAHYSKSDTASGGNWTSHEKMSSNKPTNKTEHNIHFIPRNSYILKKCLKSAAHRFDTGPSNVDTDTQSSFCLQSSHKALLQFIAGVNSAVHHRKHYITKTQSSNFFKSALAFSTFSEYIHTHTYKQTYKVNQVNHI